MRLQELVNDIDFVNEFDTDPLESYLKTEVATQYNVPYDEPEADGLASTKETGIRESVEELIQHLTDLGYFSEDELFAVIDPANNGSLTLPPNFEARVEAYLADDFVLSSQYNIPRVNISDPTFVDFLTIANERLSIITSLDGEMDEEIDFRKGDFNIYTRILHFRITTLGLYMKPVADPVSDDSVIGAHRALLITKQINHDQFGEEIRQKRIKGRVFNQLGNAYAIATALQKSYHRHQLGFYLFQTSITAEASFPFLFDNNGKIITSFEHKDFVNKLREADIARWKWTENQPEIAEVYDDQVMFGRRLLQVLLWMNGFYAGRIDGLWAEKTHQALLDFIKLQGVEDRRELLVYTGDMIWAFSFTGFLTRILSYQQPLPDSIRNSVGGSATDDEIALTGLSEDKAQLLEKMEEQLANDAERPALSDQQEKDNIGFVRRFFEGIKKIGRRIYYGARSLVTNAIKGIKDIWRFIRDEVIGPAANFFRHLLKQIRQGVRSFFAGMKRFFHFLLRKPIASCEDDFLVVTKFDIDSDCIRYISNDCPGGLLRTHQDLITQLTHQLSTFMRVGGKVIAMIIMLRPPFGWIKLALKIGSIILNEIRSRVRKQVIP